MKPFRGMAAMAVGAGLFWAGTTAWNSDALHLENVKVTGAEPSKVSVAEVAVAGGLIRGRHLLNIPTGKAEARIERIPWVAEAAIRRILPSTVEVSIKQRVPFLVVVFAGQPFLADAEGVVLSSGEAKLPRILDLPGPPPAPGARIAGGAFEHAGRILESLEPMVRSRLTSLKAPSVERITLLLEDDAEVIYGAAEKLSQKNFAIKTVLEKHAASGQQVATVDVRVPTRVAVRLRPASTG